MKFFPIFGLHLLHPYYTDGRCPDFAIEPTPDTQRLLRNHRCVLKTTPNGIGVFTGGTDPRVPLIPLQKGAIFAFHLRLQNPDFALFTDLSEITSQAAPLYTNAGAELAHNSQFSLVSRKSQLAKGVFADVEIRLNESLPAMATAPGEFSIAFKTKQARWKYYCITDVSTAEAELRIVDAAPSPLTFSDNNRTHLNQHPDSADAIAVALGERYPDKQRFRFVSDSPIPCQQAARKQLQLRFGENRLAEGLPNPSPQNYSTMAVTVGGTLQQQDVLFHVIKYFTHAFPTTGS